MLIPRRKRKGDVTRIRRITFDPRDPNNGLRIFRSDGTAISVFCSHILLWFEPTYYCFWPNIPNHLNNWLVTKRRFTTHLFPRVAPEDPVWGHFHKCSLTENNRAISIEMAGGPRHEGDTYLLTLKNLLTNYVHLGLEHALSSKRKSQTIKRIKNSRRDKILTIWLSDGDRITLSSHDVLSHCDYRYDYYCGG